MIKNVILDTKIFVLFVIGTIDRDYISKFLKTKEFTKQDYDLIVEKISFFDKILVTPHILTEFSHFTIEQKSFRDDYRKNIKVFLEQMQKNKLQENHILIQKIALNKSIYYLGIADVSLMELCNDDTLVFTSDGPLADKLREENKNVLKFIPIEGFVNY
jgi:superfamily II DNA or RNA helicase